MIRVYVWEPIHQLLDAPIGAMVGGDVHPGWVVPYDSNFRRFGHGGIEFINVELENGTHLESAYRSFWPAIGADFDTSAPGRVITDLSYDIGEESSRPNHIITLGPGVNESRVFGRWSDMQARTPDFNGFDSNCCRAVAGSIIAGFPASASSSAPAYPPMTFAGGYFPNWFSNPYALKAWTEAVNVWLTGLGTGTRPAPAVVPDVVTHGHHDRS